MPVVHVLMTNKTFESYTNVFSKLIELLEDNKLNTNFDNVKFMCDFETPLSNANKEYLSFAF